MLVSKQVATHAAIMTLDEKVIHSKSPQLRDGYERSLTRLSRTYLAQMDALKRYRAKAQSYYCSKLNSVSPSFYSASSE